MVKKIVNSDGEIVGKIFDGDRIIRKSSIEYLKNTEKSMIDNFIKISNESIDVLLELNLSEIKIFLIACKYIRYESGLIAFKNGNPLSYKDFATLLNVHEVTASKKIESLIKKNILCRERNGNKVYYYGNPNIFCKGKRINKELYKKFYKE